MCKQTATERGMNREARPAGVGGETKTGWRSAAGFSKSKHGPPLGTAAVGVKQRLLGRRNWEQLASRSSLFVKDEKSTGDGLRGELWNVQSEKS